MTTLSDRTIHAEWGRTFDFIRSDPDQRQQPGLEDWRVQPSTIEVTLSGTDGSLLGYTFPRDRAAWGIIDPEDPPAMVPRPWGRDRASDRRYYIIQPGEFLLGSTAESLRLDKSLCARVEGKSSLGRLGLMIHSTAGFVDPGFEGNLTLEFFNAAPRPIRLWAGMRVGQIRLERLTTAATRGYGDEGLGSHYQMSAGTFQAASVALSACGRPSPCGHNPDGGNHPVQGQRLALDHPV